MNDPRYLELTRSIIVDNYTPERRAWIRRLAAQREPELNVKVSPLTILWIAAGIWLTVVLLLVWGCTEPPQLTNQIACHNRYAVAYYTGAYLREEPTAYVVHIDDMTQVAYPKDDCYRVALTPPKPPKNLRVIAED